MKVNDIIKDVANLLQLSDVLDFDFETDTLSNESELTQRDINLIVKCLNQVLTRIATEHFEFLKKESITINNGSFNLSNLTEQFYKIKSVNKNKKFKVVDGKLIVDEDGTYEVVYSYIPEEFEIGDEFDFCENLSKFAICYGICSEYCLILGDFAQSETWESKFENSLDSAKSDLRIPKIRPRRWI